jgi:hypothetical protein
MALIRAKKMRIKVDTGFCEPHDNDTLDSVSDQQREYCSVEEPNAETHEDDNLNDKKREEDRIGTMTVDLGRW